MIVQRLEYHLNDVKFVQILCTLPLHLEIENECIATLQCDYMAFASVNIVQLCTNLETLNTILNEYLFLSPTVEMLILSRWYYIYKIYK